MNLDELKKQIEEWERRQFEAWFETWVDTNVGMVENAIEKSAAWAAWSARSKTSPPCKGRERPGCNYLGHCGRICNKCGHAH